MLSLSSSSVLVQIVTNNLRIILEPQNGLVWSDLKDILSNPCQGLTSAGTWVIHDLRNVKLEAGTSSHRAGGSSEGFLSAVVGSPTLSWVEELPCRGVGCAQGFAELSCSEQGEGQRGAETFLNLPLSAFPLPWWSLSPAPLACRVSKAGNSGEPQLQAKHSQPTMPL